MEAIDLFDFRGWFIHTYKPRLYDRWPTFQIALNWFVQHKGITIVETGTLRFDAWEGDGRSTYVFGDFCQRHDARLYTVDHDPKMISASERATSKFADVISYFVSDSVQFLKGFSRPIHLLYLDSHDYNHLDPLPSQRHCLAELEAALPNLSAKACVLIDDNCENGGGKGELAKPILAKNGFVCLLDSYQSVWVRT